MVTPRLERGEVWLICLDPTVGSEIKKTRPCLIVSPPELHQYLRTVLVVPLTSKGFPAPFRIAVDFAGQKGLLLLDQMRSVDKQRLVKHLGTVHEVTLLDTLARLREMFEV
jgi:mRNA interferase MazF